jgi:hypothetical protein
MSRTQTSCLQYCTYSLDGLIAPRAITFRQKIWTGIAGENAGMTANFHKIKNVEQ